MMTASQRSIDGQIRENVGLIEGSLYYINSIHMYLSIAAEYVISPNSSLRGSLTTVQWNLSNPTLFSGPIECWIREFSLYINY